MSRESDPILSDFEEVTFEESKKMDEPFVYSRWQSFCAICLVVSVAASSYAYGIFSSLLENNLGYTEQSLDIIASVGNTGLYSSIVTGFMIEYFGYKRVIMFGGLCIFAGFLYIYLAVMEVISSSFSTICLFYFLAQVGASCHITSAVAVSVQLFPKEARGAAIGMSKGYFGLSSAILGDLAGGYFSMYPSLFVLFVAVFLPFAGNVGQYFSNALPSHLVPYHYERRFSIPTSIRPVLLHWIGLFLTAMVIGYVQYAYDLPDLVLTLLSALLIAAVFSILFLPDLYGDRVVPVEIVDPRTFKESMMAARRMQAKARGYATFSDEHSMADLYSGSMAVKERTDSISSDMSTDSDRERRCKSFLWIEEPGVLASDDDSAGFIKAEVHEQPLCFYGDPMPLSQSIFTWRLWAFFLIYVVTCGTSLMVIYNVNAIAEAVDITPSAFFVTLVSLANGCGRVVAGLLSDSITRWTGLSKLELFSFVIFAMSLGHAVLAVGDAAYLSVSLLWIGFTFGCNVALCAVNVADAFGDTYVATNFGLVDTGPILGSYVFATIVVNEFYSANTNVQDDALATCVGANCFQTQFLINSCCCLLASALCFIVHSFTPYSASFTSGH